MGFRSPFSSGSILPEKVWGHDREFFDVTDWQKLQINTQCEHINTRLGKGISKGAVNAANIHQHQLLILFAILYMHLKQCCIEL